MSAPFPDSLLQIAIAFAFGADPDGDAGSWTWTYVPGEHILRQEASIQRGRADETSQSQPTTISFQLDNQSGDYTPDNPRSIYYPNIRRGTPALVQMHYDGVWYTRCLGSVDEWTPEWPWEDISVGDYPGESFIAVTVSGVLRRLGQGQSPLNSALFRYNSESEFLAYWPLEDGRGSSYAWSPGEGVSPMSALDVQFASADDLPGSAPVVAMNQNASLAGRVPYSYGQSPPWQLDFYFNIEKPPPSPTLVNFFDIYTSSDQSARIRVAVNDLSLNVTTFDPDGVETSSQSVLNTGFNFYAEWRYLIVTAHDIGGGNFELRLYWYTAANPSLGALGFDWTLPGSAGEPRLVRFHGSGALAGYGLGHIAVRPWFWTVHDGALNPGWIGELAGDRIWRLCDLEGIWPDILGDPVYDMPMGAQPVGTLLELLTECAEADGGALYEPIDLANALTYRPRSTLYNQTPTLVLDAASSEISSPFAPTFDDQRLRNDVTVQRVDGSTAHVIDQQHIDENLGRYDVQYTLNVESDDLLGSIASWELHLGTWPGMRYPKLTVDLTTASQRIIEWITTSLEIGNRVQVVNLPRQHPTDTVDLLMEGYTETLANNRWIIELNCSPAGPWNVGVIDDGTDPQPDQPGPTRLDTDGSELIRAVGSIPSLDNPNPSFERNLDGWQALQGTLERTHVIAHDGRSSALLTPDGVSPAAVAEQPVAGAIPVVAGNSYTLSGWFYSPNGYPSVRIFVTWVGGGATTDFGPLVALPAEEWAYLTYSVTAPAGSTGARWRFRLQGDPAATDITYIDEARIDNTPVSDLLVATIPPGAPRWTADPTQMPFDIVTGGERMTVTSVDSGVADDFTPPNVFNGWGNAETGQAWSTAGGVASDYERVFGNGIVKLPTPGLRQFTSIGGPYDDLELFGTISLSDIAAGNNVSAALLSRYQDANNFYMFQILYLTSGSTQLYIVKRVAGSFTSFGLVAGPDYEALAPLYLRTRTVGTMLQARLWRPDEDEPDWMVTADDSEFASGAIGTHSASFAGNTNPDLQVIYRNIRTHQIMTATRAVNEINKPHDVGADIRLANPFILSV